MDPLFFTAKPLRNRRVVPWQSRYNHTYNRLRLLWYCSPGTQHEVQSFACDEVVVLGILLAMILYDPDHPL
jgi:hypothetical protein